MKKDQHVIACIESAASADTVLACARHCAERLNHKGIILLNVSPEGTDNGWIRNYDVPYVGLHGDWKTAIEGLPTAFGGILAVAMADPAAPRRSITNPATLLRTFGECKTAYLVVGRDWRDDGGRWPRSTVVTVDHRRESKEKLIWASYFARFLGSRLTMALPAYRDEDLLRRQRENMRFSDKFFHSLNVEYQEAAVSNKALESPDITALAELSPDLLVSLCTDRRDLDVGDWLLGAPERRLLGRSNGNPILFLNQRDDLYVLCD